MRRKDFALTVSSLSSVDSLARSCLGRSTADIARTLRRVSMAVISVLSLCTAGSVDVVRSAKNTRKALSICALTVFKHTYFHPVAREVIHRQSTSLVRVPHVLFVIVTTAKMRSLAKYKHNSLNRALENDYTFLSPATISSSDLCSYAKRRPSRGA